MLTGVSAACEPKKTPTETINAMVAHQLCSYRDHSHITDDDKELNALMDKADAEGVKGTDQTFPVKLHQLLSGSDEDGFSHIVSWQTHGRSFIVKNHPEFVEKVLPCCFRQSKFASFQRQLNLYGFRRITQGRDKGGYYHELFLRGRSLLALKMQRTKVKGTGARKASSPETEPDFYAMPFVHETKSKQSKKPSPNSPAVEPVVVSPPATMPAPAPAVAAMSLLVPPPLAANARLQRLLEETSASAKPVAKPESTLTRTALLGSPGAATGRIPSSGFPTGAFSLPETSQDIIAQVLASRARLQALRDGPSLSTSSLPGSSFLLSNPRRNSFTQCGPLHLNAFNMPCNCALPAF